MTSLKELEFAIDSLVEELIAVKVYFQRVRQTKDKELKAILSHNLDEEKEHAAMLINWLRSIDKEFDKKFTEHD